MVEYAGLMCRNGNESSGTTPRRCECSDEQRQSHNSARTMTRTAAQLRTADDESRREVLRSRFIDHCYRYRSLNGMEDGEFPVVPEDVSRVSRYDADSLEALPWETLEAQSMKEAEEGDWLAAEALCAELDRRQEFADENPYDMEILEEERWEGLRNEGLPEGLDHLDPVVHPMARSTGNSAKDREKRMRVEYESWLEGQMMKAEEETRGTLFNARGRSKALRNPNITARSMWTNHIMAKHYASEELKRYWSEPGNERLSFAAFTERWTTGAGEANERVSKSELLNF